jgi:hypothetical protein
MSPILQNDMTTHIPALWWWKCLRATCGNSAAPYSVVATSPIMAACAVALPSAMAGKRAS